MLALVVAFKRNSRRARQSAECEGLARHESLASALPQRNRALTGSSSSRPGFVIANPELDFPVTRCKQTSGVMANRKYLAVSRRRFSASSCIPCTFDVRTSGLQNLIANTRLELELNRKDPNHLQISNREQMAICRSTHSFRPPTHRSPVRRSVSVAPAYRKAIMSRHHFILIPRFEPLVRKVTNADPNQS